MSVAIESLLFAATEVEIVAASKVPTVNIVAYTGGLMSVSGWGPIVVDLKGIDASAEQIGILARRRPVTDVDPAARTQTRLRPL